jgi:hypothetical protein
MPERLKGRGQTKCRPCSSRSGVGHGANRIPEKFTVTKPSPWRRPKPSQGYSASKEEEEEEEEDMNDVQSSAKYIHCGKFVLHDMISHVQLCEKYNGHHSQQFHQRVVPPLEHDVILSI